MNQCYDDDKRTFVSVENNAGIPVVMHHIAPVPVPRKPAERRSPDIESSILSEDDAIAGHSRSRDYGHPLENHQRIADVWNMQLSPKLTAPIEPREVALMMIGLKLAREVNAAKRDSLVDIAGYVKCVELIDQETERLATAK